VNGRHLLAFLWLRWRLRVNQFKRAGVVNTVLTIMFLAACVPGVIALFVAALIAGIFGLPLIAEKLPDEFPVILMLIWDGLALMFLFAWMIGLLSELQRSEALSLDKFLHLPVSLSGVFVMNYLSSLASFTLMAFLPVMLGLILGLAIGLSPSMLLLLPAMAAFVLAVTGPSYQFQGWLAAMMVNPRKRRTVVVFVTMAIILISQAPQVINFMMPWQHDPEAELRQERVGEQHKLDVAVAAGKISRPEYNQRTVDLTREYQEKTNELERNLWAQVKEWALILNIALPPGWFAIGAWSLPQGDVWPALAGTAGLALIGTASLWRAYRTTLRLYTGQYNAGTRQATVAATAAPAPAIATPRSDAPTLLERRLPGFSERTAAIAFASFRALMRAPEVKMILLTPFIFLLLFGGMLFMRTGGPPEMVRPLLPYAAMAITLLCMTQLIGNQFGFDRSGFRVFVLSPAPRDEIIIGKNLAAAPIALGLVMLMSLILAALFPMRIDLLLAALVQCVSMYVLYCMLANVLSILAPMQVAAGSAKPVQSRTVTVLIHIGFGLFYPLIAGPVMMPLGVQFLVDELSPLPGLPIALVLALLECAGTLYLYRVVVRWEGRLLQWREQHILEVVTTKAE
jgi:ABC-2 type transport system permease protein